MQQQLISFETAKLAKEKGFKQLCDFSYDEDGILTSNCEQAYNYVAPTQSLLQKWLREKYDIHINIDCFSERGGTGWDYQIVKCDYNSVGLPGYILTEFNDNRKYPSYEHALEDGLIDALKWVEFLHYKKIVE